MRGSLYLAPAHPAAMLGAGLRRAPKHPTEGLLDRWKRSASPETFGRARVSVGRPFTAVRHAAMPVDHDAVEIDRKEVDAPKRWIASNDEPIRWQERLLTAKRLHTVAQGQRR